MPMDLLVHSRDCAYLRGKPCNCKPKRFTDADAAREAHEGNAVRLQIAAVVPPTPRLPEPIPAYRSQARRHTRSISD